MSTISHKMLNDSIGKMNKNAYYSSKYTPNNPETKEEKEKREKKRIKELKSLKTKRQIKNVLLTVERDEKYDKEVDVDYAKILISGVNKELSKEQVEKIAENRAKIRKNTISEKNRDSLDNMILIATEDSSPIDNSLLVPKRYS